MSSAIRYALMLIAVVMGGWMLYDGIHAFVTGNYTTPGSGDYAGKLGPWAGLVAAVGLQPTGLIMKSLHVLLGASWLVSGYLLMRSSGARTGPLLLTAVLSLWYLPFGTLAGALVLALVGIPAWKSKP